MSFAPEAFGFASAFTGIEIVEDGAVIGEFVATPQSHQNGPGVQPAFR